METTEQPFLYNNRDLSWLAFNGRVLDEASRPEVPLLERVKFLSIFSSNLDEFYRVRMPVLAALQRIDNQTTHPDDRESLKKASLLIAAQQEQFGRTLRSDILPGLAGKNIHLYYNQALPEEFYPSLYQYLYNELLCYITIQKLSITGSFFPENNCLYFLVDSNNRAGERELIVINIPSDKTGRFYSIQNAVGQAVFFIDDIIKMALPILLPNVVINGCYSFKITRDAELDLKDEYPGDVAEEIEIQLNKRDKGLATRFLHDPDMPLTTLFTLKDLLGINNAVEVAGGKYHNLKDLADFPAKDVDLRDKKWPAIAYPVIADGVSVFDTIANHDMLLHVPYQSYNSILRFFNEAAIRPDVEEISVTLYRVARDSKIANALISAAANGKKVTVMIELKARFDEANNIRWARKMKAAGVKIVYSITALKVHAKVALVKLKSGMRTHYAALLATGNFNESTAAFYTDHILMTASPQLTRELELLFIFLGKRQKPSSPQLIPFKHLLVSQFNLQQRFLSLIDGEIELAMAGKPASIVIKLNNLEERILINKLYQASNAGVNVQLIVRSICCLKPGVQGMSKNITVRRIVDRYLEHGRIFIFGNQGNAKVYMGSADWMNRNIYRRIEVCFPVTDALLKEQLLQLINLQLNDTGKAVWVDHAMQNTSINGGDKRSSSQHCIYQYLATK